MFAKFFLNLTDIFSVKLNGKKYDNCKCLLEYEQVGS